MLIKQSYWHSCPQFLKVVWWRLWLCQDIFITTLNYDGNSFRCYVVNDDTIIEFTKYIFYFKIELSFFKLSRRFYDVWCIWYSRACVICSNGLTTKLRKRLSLFMSRLESTNLKNVGTFSKNDPYSILSFHQVETAEPTVMIPYTATTYDSHCMILSTS